MLHRGRSAFALLHCSAAGDRVATRADDAANHDEDDAGDDRSREQGNDAGNDENDSGNGKQHSHDYRPTVKRVETENDDMSAPYSATESNAGSLPLDSLNTRSFRCETSKPTDLVR